MNQSIKVIKGIVKTQRLEDTALYTDITVMYEGQVYNVQRTFGDQTVEIFRLMNPPKRVPRNKIYVIVVQDENNKIYHLDRVEIDKVADLNLLGKEVHFTVYNRMVTSENFYENGTVRLRGDRPHPLLSAKIEYPKPPAPDNSVDMLNEPDDLSFEVFFNRQVIPDGHHCGDCPYYHYLYFQDPRFESSRVKVPYCLFLKQGSIPFGMPEYELDSICKALNVTVDQLTDSDSGLLGLDGLWDGIKACDINKNIPEYPFK